MWDARVRASEMDRTGEVVRVHLCEEKKERWRDGVFSLQLSLYLLLHLSSLSPTLCPCSSFQLFLFPLFFLPFFFFHLCVCVCVCLSLFSFPFLLLVCRGVCVRVRVLVRGM